MKVAIYIDTLPYSGGGIQSINYAIKFEKILSLLNIKSLIVTNNTETYKVQNFKNIKLIKKNYLDHLYYYLSGTKIFKIIFKKMRYKTSFEKFFQKEDVELVIFTSPSSKCLYLTNLNYMICVWDLCHRNNLEFPEVRDHNEFEIREDFYELALKKSYCIITDTEELSHDINFYYRIKSNRIITIPFDLNQKFKKLKEHNFSKKIEYQNYFLYPAQFWSHKNHFYLLEAYRKLKNSEVSLIFCGQDKGTKEEIKKYILKNELNKNVIILDYVNDEDLYLLYQNCIAVIMPTMFGYSNIPPLEAWFFNKQILYSKNFGSKFIGEGYQPIDPLNSENIYEKLNEIISQKNEKKSQININLLNNNELIDHGIVSFKNKIIDFQKISKCWNYD